MSMRTILEYARLAAQAEQRILDLLDSALREEYAADRSETDLHNSAQPRQGQDSSG